MQVLGMTQWMVLVAGVQDTTYTVHGLTKGAQYLFRVITATPKTNSKPSPLVGPVKLLDRGECTAGCWGREAERAAASPGLGVGSGGVVTKCVSGPYLDEAPVILDKPDVVYVVEGQPASITITINHVEATVIWKR